MQKARKKNRSVPYIESVHYQVRLTARYTKILGEQFFKKMCIKIPFEEFISLAVIKEYGSMCQRDLARLILKDRANTGRIAQSLKKAGYISITNDTKNNRLIKKILITEKGEFFLNDVMSKIAPVIEVIESKFKEKEIETLVDLLKRFRDVTSTVIEIKM